MEKKIFIVGLPSNTNLDGINKSESKYFISIYDQRKRLMGDIVFNYNLNAFVFNPFDHGYEKAIEYFLEFFNHYRPVIITKDDYEGHELYEDAKKGNERAIKRLLVRNRFKYRRKNNPF